MLDADDVPGQQVNRPAAGSRKDTSAVTTSQPECDVQAHITAGIAAGKPSASVQRETQGVPGESARADDPVRTAVTLASYAKKGEEKVRFDLGKAGTVCQYPFNITVDGVTLKAHALTGRGAPEAKESGRDLGDSFAWFTLTRGSGVRGVTFRVVVARVGHTLAFVSREYPRNIDDRVPADMPLPEDIAAAQVKKLRKVSQS